VVRKSAARSLGQLKDRSALPFLEEARQDRSPMVRNQVKIALQEIEGVFKKV
jgi:HEAT repeat protein